MQHKLGLKVYAFGFANDFTAGFTDGVVTDFPSTISNVIGEITNRKSPTLSS